MQPLIIVLATPVVLYITLWWAIPLLWLLIISLLRGVWEGVYIGWHEVRARTIVKRCQKEGGRIYDLPIWALLRRITLDRARNRRGFVVCKDCRETTHEPHCHHIEMVAYKPALAFTPSNLAALCPDCHQARHPEIDLSRKRGQRRNRRKAGARRRLPAGFRPLGS